MWLCQPQEGLLQMRELCTLESSPSGSHAGTSDGTVISEPRFCVAADKVFLLRGFDLSVFSLQDGAKLAALTLDSPELELQQREGFSDYRFWSGAGQCGLYSHSRILKLCAPARETSRPTDGVDAVHSHCVSQDEAQRVLSSQAVTAGPESQIWKLLLSSGRRIPSKQLLPAVTALLASMWRSLEQLTEEKEPQSQDIPLAELTPLMVELAPLLAKWLGKASASSHQEELNVEEEVIRDEMVPEPTVPGVELADPEILEDPCNVVTLALDRFTSGSMLRELELLLLDCQIPEGGGMPASAYPSHIFFSQDQLFSTSDAASVKTGLRDSKEFYFEILCNLLLEHKPDSLCSFIYLLESSVPSFAVHAELEGAPTFLSRAAEILSLNDRTFSSPSALKTYVSVMSSLGRHSELVR